MVKAGALLLAATILTGCGLWCQAVHFWEKCPRW